MNCECIYYSKSANDQDYKFLAKVIDARDCELDSISLSAITRNIRMSEFVYGEGRRITIPKDSKVVFAAGKYHNMDAIRIGRKVFNPWFPVDCTEADFFKDIETF